MQADRWKKVEEVFEAARQQPADGRAGFLRQACPGDPELCAEVESLLKAADTGDPLLDGSPLSSIVERPPALKPGDHLGSFEILGLIGRGGMGEVYRARDQRLKREVAIKTLPAGLARDPDRIARFEREARAASALNHPNIVCVYDIGRDSGTHWIASELVSGDTLRRVIEAGPLPAPKAIEVAVQVASGLAAAHAAGLVHRDLKPDNIMVARGGQVKILDFGLAKQRRPAPDSTTADLTDEGTVLGTAGYMSPEQIRCEPTDHRSDLFSFGVVLYEILSGRRAFSGGSSIEVMNAILKAEPTELPASVPPALAHIVRRCLEKEPDRRFQSAADLAFALQPSPPSLPEPTAPKRGTGLKWAGLAALFVAAMGAAFLWLSRPLPQPRITGTVQITSDGRGSGAPMFTDGTRLFFSLADFPGRQVSIKGGESVPLALPSASWVVNVSPDRTEFLVYRYHDQERSGVYRDELWVAPVLGGSPRRLGNLLATTRVELHSGAGFPTPERLAWDDVHQSAAAWSVDGQQLVYARDHELHLARIDGTEVRKLATLPGFPFFVRWSPDGRTVRLSVSSANDTESSLWEVSIDNGHMLPLLPGWDPTWYTCCGNWTADGKYFVFQSRSNIWALREKTGFLQRASREPVQLNTGPMSMYWPLPSLDGKCVFVAGYRARKEFVRYDVKSRRFVPELAGVSGDELEFSKDEKWVTYVSVPEGGLIRSAPDGSQRLQLTWPPFAVGGPHWSPDGRHIAFSGGPAGQPARIYVVPFDGGPVRQVTNGESGKHGDHDPTWSPDGASLVFGAFGEPSGVSIRLVDLTSGRVSVLPGSEEMWSPRWSPDGRFVAGFSWSGSKLMLYDLRTRKQTMLHNGRSWYPSWSGDGAYLFFSSGGWWWRVRMSDRKVDRVVNLDGVGLGGPWCAVAPDNSLIAARRTGTQEIFALNWEAP